VDQIKKEVIYIVLGSAPRRVTRSMRLIKPHMVEAVAELCGPPKLNRSSELEYRRPGVNDTLFPGGLQGTFGIDYDNQLASFDT